MKEIKFTPSFKRAMKKVKQYPDFSLEELNNALQTLADGGQLPAAMNNHPMAKHSPGFLKGAWDFHLRGNLVVVYKIDKDTIEVLNIGKHNQLRLTSSYQYHKK